MIQFAYIALLIAPILGIATICLGGGRARFVAGFIIFAWLFLPLLAIKFAEGIPAYDKALAIGLGAMLGVAIARPGALLSLRPNWIDLPMLVWCLVPIASSLSNNLGFYDGLSASFRQTVVFGAPYLIGRALLGSYGGLFELARMLFIGGIVYFPFILFESKMSAQLHLWIYAISGRSGYETANFWGPLRYRPSVFLNSALELTPLMGAAALCGIWLWKTGRLRRMMNVGIKWLVAAAVFSCLLGKSLGGTSLTAAGGGVLYLSKKYQRKIFLVILLAVSPTYIVTRSTGMWSGDQLISFLKDYVSERRAESLDTRLVNENQLFARASERPIFGWGGWGRNEVHDENGKIISITDGMWIIAAGTNGLVGLAALYGSLLLPVAVMLKRANGRLLWNEPAAAGVFVMMVIVVLHSIDFLANAMPNPVYFVAAGGLATIAIALRHPTTAGQLTGNLSAPVQARAKRLVRI